MDHLNLLTSQPPRSLYSDEGADDDDAEALPGRRRSSISSLSASRHRLHRGERVLPLHSCVWLKAIFILRNYNSRYSAFMLMP